MPFGGLLTAGIVTAGIATAAGAGIKGYQAYKASEREEQAQKALNELSQKPYAKSTTSPALQSFYNRVLSRSMNPQGLSPVEMAAAKKGIADTQATTMYNVKGASGGNLSRYITGALAPQYATATGNLYTTSARMKREDENRYMGMLGNVTGNIQNIQDRNTQMELQRRMEQERMLGQSVLQNRAFTENTIGSIGSDLIGGGLMIGMNSLGGGSKASSGGAGGYKTRTGKNKTGYLQPSDPEYIG